MTTGQVLWGLSNGVLVFAIAGAFWFGMALGPVAFAIGVVPWLAVLAVMLGGAAALVRAALRLRRRSGFRTSDLRRTDPETRRIITGFRIVGLLEATLVAAAVLLCRRFGRLDLVWPAIGVAVSLHFLPLARLLNVPAYYVTALAGALVSLAALVGPFGPSRLLWLGAGMSAVMWISAIHVVYRADIIAARSLTSPHGKG
jgi:MFS family permease